MRLGKGKVDPRIADSEPGVEMICNTLLLAKHEERRLLMLEEQVGEEISDLDVEEPTESGVKGPRPGAAFEICVELREFKKALRNCRMRVMLTDTDFVVKGRASRHLHDATHDCFVETAGSQMMPGQTISDLGLEAGGLLVLFKDVSPYVGRMPWNPKELLKEPKK